jgi:hypothetical protein
MPIVNARRGIGIELKPSYFRQMKKNVAAALQGGFSDETGQEYLSLTDEADLEEFNQTE